MQRQNFFDEIIMHGSVPDACMLLRADMTREKEGKNLKEH